MCYSPLKLQNSHKDIGRAQIGRAPKLLTSKNVRVNNEDIVYAALNS